MELLDTSLITDFPGKVKLGFTEIKADLSVDLLSERERSEWDSFTNQQRKNEYLSARHLFKEMLKASGMSSDFQIFKHPLGKPYAQNGNKVLFLSFSHSKNHVFCAISESVDIGLDTEWLGRKVDQRIVKRILGESEWEVFSDEDPILLWTIKEAAVKCLGTGLRTNLKELEIQKNNEVEFLVRINDEKTFQICSFRELNHQISIAY
ncbi:MAG: 4'-phosphopantetheinyl transferase superfamily protein [Balneola sp.]|nr:4'-phosphopantetheinyl transferase superfamily protein [Balneola sp.]MBO6650425.1 4'-phosphopantetheinyl transferase superfamily protein [Balneola sp.]MBO6710179.1 4'-phosphopantetheinyl transferase superfamily protein [Balneola sp.]MBO6798863.1 4'-phosphopantetheinyl transferase superfamily protein [Balneola sp.]MBO6869977.1 4'-phosphopantetheinyl transferase superfamily protein [Balneola sp.]